MLNLWQTVVGEYAWTEALPFNRKLAQQIMALYEENNLQGQGPVYPRITHKFRSEGFAALDVRGFLSDGFWEFLCTAVNDYLNEVRPAHYDVCAEDFTSVWPNVNRAGDYHAPHRHSSLEHILAGTYYVSVPDFDAPFEGALSLLDPRGTLGGSAAYRQFYGEGEIRVEPKPGQVVLFPPHVAHYVAPHRASTPRVSVSFNVSTSVLERSTAARRKAPPAAVEGVH